MQSERGAFDADAYADRVAGIDCFICAFLEGDPRFRHEIVHENEERTYVLSLGSQQGDRHLHIHVAALPPGTPAAEQQLVAMTAERGVVTTPPGLADRIRSAFAV